MDHEVSFLARVLVNLTDKAIRWRRDVSLCTQPIQALPGAYVSHTPNTTVVFITIQPLIKHLIHRTSTPVLLLTLCFKVDHNHQITT